MFKLAWIRQRDGIINYDHESTIKCKPWGLKFNSISNKGLTQIRPIYAGLGIYLILMILLRVFSEKETSAGPAWFSPPQDRRAHFYQAR